MYLIETLIKSKTLPDFVQCCHATGSMRNYLILHMFLTNIFKNTVLQN